MTVSELIYALASHPMDAEVGVTCTRRHGWVSKVNGVGTAEGAVVLDQEEEGLFPDEVEVTLL